MNEFLVYLVMQLDYIRGWGITVALLAAIVCGVRMTINGIYRSEQEKNKRFWLPYLTDPSAPPYKEARSKVDTFEAEVTKATGMINRNFRQVWVALLSTLVFGAIVPTTQTMCAVVVVPAVLKSKAIQADLPEVYNMAVEKLKSQLK